MKEFTLNDLTIQTFDDSGQERKELAQIFSFDGNSKRIVELQRKGAGIYFAINPQENKDERGIQNTSQFKRLGLDLDVSKEANRTNREEINTRKESLTTILKTLPIPPHYFTETKNGLHPVWEFSNPKQLPLNQRLQANEEYKKMVKGVCKIIGTESEGDSICRVLRLRNTLHLKTPSSPFKIKIQYCNDDPVSVEDFIKAYPPIGEVNNSQRIADISKGVDDGSRAVDEASYVGFLLSYIPERHWESIAWPTVQGWNLKNNPPLSEYKLRQVFDSIAGKEARKKASQSNPSIGYGTDLIRLQIEPLRIEDISPDQLNINWIWGGYLAHGELTILSALPKAGKSTLVSHLLKRFQDGQDFIGQEVKQGKVLIISEESKSIWARKRIDLDLTGDIWVIPQPFREKPTYNAWKTLLEQCAEFVKQNKIDLVVVDTLTSFWSVRDEGSAPEVQAALLPLINITDTGAGCLIIHHHKKTLGAQGTAARGSTAFGSAVSVLIDLQRLEGTNPQNTQRRLSALSRFDETPLDVVIDLVNDEYILIGTSAQASRASKIEKVLEKLPEEPGGISVTAFINKLKAEKSQLISRSTLTRYLEELKTASKVKITGYEETGTKKAPLYGKVKSNQITTNPLGKNDLFTPQQPQETRHDPYGKDYWKRMPAANVPQWIKDKYGL